MRLTGWYAGWNIIALVMLFQGVSFGAQFFGFTFWVGPWMREFDVSRAEIMVAAACLEIMIGLVSPFVGRALDRMSIRALICTGALLEALSFLLISTATSVWQIILIYATLLGVGVSLIGPLAGQVLAVKWFRARRGLAAGVVLTGIPIGGLLLPPLIAVLYTSFGWRTTHVILAGLVVLLIALPAWFFIRNTPQEVGIEPEAPGRETEPSNARMEAVEPVLGWTTRNVLSQRVFWLLAIGVTVLNLLGGAIQHNLAPLAEDLGFTIGQAALLVSVEAVALILGLIFFGRVADRWDARYIYWFAAALAGSSIFLMIGSPSYLLLLGLCAMLGFAQACQLPLLSKVVREHFGTHAFGQVAGLVVLPPQVLSLFGATLMAWSRDQSGSYDLGLMFGLMVLIPAALLMAWLPKANNPEHSVRSNELRNTAIVISGDAEAEKPRCGKE